VVVDHHVKQQQSQQFNPVLFYLRAELNSQWSINKTNKKQQTKQQKQKKNGSEKAFCSQT
jgi:hypothetical protein